MNLPPATHSRPSLVLQTVSFDESDRDAARQLGLDLYDVLSRPQMDPLAFGAGIPVYCAVAAEAIDLQTAHTVVIIPVLGTLTFSLQADAVIARIREWHEQLGEGHVLPVPVDAVWRNVEGQLPGMPLLTELHGVEPRRRATIDEIVLATSRLLAKDSETTTLFLSHARADLVPTKKAAEQIKSYVETSTTGSAFFDRTELLPGELLSEKLDFAASRGVFVAVRGDSYSSRIWCQHEMLQAKKHSLPTLTVEVLQKGERRSLAYGGNSPTIVWGRGPEDPGEVVSQAMIEWLRAAYFRREAGRMLQAAGLPECKVLIRPPELLDMAQGPLRAGEPLLVIHPDPELPVVERRVLQSASPRMRLVTPLTAWRRVLSQDSAVPGDAPLQGLQVALSLSDSPDIHGAEGYTKHHVVDVTVLLARAMISAGASIAYGGDFRQHDMMDPKRHGFTLLLVDLISAYNQTAAQPAEFLHSYLAAPIPLGDVPEDTPMRLHHMVRSPDMAAQAILPPPNQEFHPAALSLSDMRQVMTKHIHARIVLGGNAEPQLEENGDGYRGRYPGVVEEAWRSLEARQPVYVIGGFGGAAALVADLLEDCANPLGPVPERLQDATWLPHEYFKKKADQIDADPFCGQLGLPRSMDDLAREVKIAAAPLLESDETSVSWNGLTLAENSQLFRSRDPVLINSLVMQGLLNVNRQLASGKLPVELVHGSVTDASELDAIAVGMFEGIPLGGAGAALDEVVGGRASAGRAEGRQLISISHSDISADWIYLASLGQPGDTGQMGEKIRSAAQETAAMAQRYGLRKIGVVAFGGTVAGSVEVVAESMLDGLVDLAGFASVSWFEKDEDRFESLRKLLADNDRVKLTTRRIAHAKVQTKPQQQPLILQISCTNGDLVVTVLPPSGNAVAGVRRQVISDDDISRFAQGAGLQQRNTPDLATLQDRGHQLAQLLLGDDADRLLAQTSEAKVLVVHDVASSRFPFEILCTSTSATPASTAGMNRRLAVPGVPVEHLFARPPKSRRFNVLLVINPTKDLPGAEREGEAVEAILRQQQGLNLTVLSGNDATQSALLNAFPSTDVLHYCGHAWFEGPGETESGLLLTGNERLTLAEVRGVEMPRVAFVNACEAGRVRGTVTSEAASFAEFFLRSGVEAYLGTFWTVNDLAAQVFAGSVYAQLAVGKTLDEAVTISRRRLKVEENLPDWANYILYGDGRFQLVKGM